MPQRRQRGATALAAAGVEPQLRPRRVRLGAQTLAHQTELLQGHTKLIAQLRDGAQPNKVAKGVDAPVRALARVIGQAWADDRRRVPIPDASLRKASDAGRVFEGEGQ